MFQTPGSQTRAIPDPDFIPWIQLILASSVPFVVMLAWLNFAPVIPLIQADFAINNTWAGMLTSATGFVHMLLQLPGGQITDTLGAKRAIVLGLVIVGIAVVLGGLAPNFAVLMLSRFILGVGTAASFIAGLALVKDLVGSNKIATAQGIYGGIGSLGILVALFTSERIASWGGWRSTLLLEGILALVIAAIVFRYLNSTPRLAKSAMVSWSEAFRQPYLYLLGIALALTYGVFMGLVTWVATFLFQSHAISLEWAGPLAAIMTTTAFIGRCTGGAITTHREKSMIVGTCLVTAVFTGLLPLLPGLIPALIVLLLLGWTANTAFGAIFSYKSVISDKPTTGRELSTINFVGNIGAAVFPLVIGSALDTTGSFTVGFGIVALMGILGSAAAFIWLPKPRKRVASVTP